VEAKAVQPDKFRVVDVVDALGHQRVVWITLSTPSPKKMGRKKSGGKVGRKTDFNDDETAFLETYANHFRAGSGHGGFYSEVVSDFIAEFGYSGLKAHNKGGHELAELKLDEDMETMSEDEKKKVLKVRKEAQQAMRTISRLFTHDGGEADHPPET
jgi:hypothetical protein